MSTIKANTLLHSDGTTTTQPSIPALDKRMAKAWVLFDGTNSGAIFPNGSYNVSSVTDNAVGDFSVNFATALPNVNYCESIQASGSGTNFCARGYGDKNTSLRDIRTQAYTSILGDANTTSYIVFG